MISAAILPANVRGALWIFAAGVAFTAMMALVKFLGEGYSVALQSVYRQSVGLLLLLPTIIRQRGAMLRTTTPVFLTVNGIISATALAMGFLSYQLLPLAEANSLSYTRMLWLVPLVAVLAGEPLRAGRVIATLAGFCGVIVMMRPHGAAIDLGHGVALLAALLSGTSIMNLKLLTRNNETLTIMTWSSIIGVLTFLPMALFEWRWPGPIDLLLLVVMGLCGVATQICYIRGLRIGEAAAVTPVDYSRLIMAAAAGWILFGETPDSATMAGSLIIVGATLFINWQEFRSSRRSSAATGLPGAEA